MRRTLTPSFHKEFIIKLEYDHDRSTINVSPRYSAGKMSVCCSKVVETATYYCEHCFFCRLIQETSTVPFTLVQRKMDCIDWPCLFQVICYCLSDPKICGTMCATLCNCKENVLYQITFRYLCTTQRSLVVNGTRTLLQISSSSTYLRIHNGRRIWPRKEPGPRWSG